MKKIEQIKKELEDFGNNHKACEGGLEAIKGDTLLELFNNISIYIYWCKNSNEKTMELNNIFDNELVIENNVLLCNCTGLNYITIPDSIISIGDFAFQNCTKLKSITIPNSVTYIGEYTFANCTELTSITIPASITSIDEGTFRGCNENLKIIRL